MSVGPSPMAIKRLKQDLMDMESDPTPGQWAKPDPANIMKWWYCIKGQLINTFVSKNSFKARKTLLTNAAIMWATSSFQRTTPSKVQKFT